MSFTENPYLCMELIFDEEQLNVKWSCNSCGGVSNISWGIGTSIFVPRENFNKHVITSHVRTREDFSTWRNPWPNG